MIRYLHRDVKLGIAFGHGALLSNDQLYVGRQRSPDFWRTPAGESRAIPRTATCIQRKRQKEQQQD